jgi:hypothetical protein
VAPDLIPTLRERLHSSQFHAVQEFYTCTEGTVSRPSSVAETEDYSIAIGPPEDGSSRRAVMIAPLASMSSAIATIPASHPIPPQPNSSRSFHRAFQSSPSSPSTPD